MNTLVKLWPAVLIVVVGAQFSYAMTFWVWFPHNTKLVCLQPAWSSDHCVTCRHLYNEVWYMVCVSRSKQLLWWVQYYYYNYSLMKLQKDPFSFKCRIGCEVCLLPEHSLTGHILGSNNGLYRRAFYPSPLWWAHNTRLASLSFSLSLYHILSSQALLMHHASRD